MWSFVFLLFVSLQNQVSVNACNDAPGLLFCSDRNFTGQSVYFDARRVGENATKNCTCTLQIISFSRFIKLKYFGPGFVACGYEFLNDDGVRIFGCTSTETVYYSTPFTTIKLHKFQKNDNSGACVGIFLDYQVDPIPNQPIPELTATCYSSDTTDAPILSTISSTTPAQPTTTETPKRTTTTKPITTTPKTTTTFQKRTTPAQTTKSSTQTTPLQTNISTETQKRTTTTTTTKPKTTFPKTTRLQTRTTTTPKRTTITETSSPAPAGRETLVLVLATTTAVGWTLLVILVIIIVAICCKRRSVSNTTKHGKVPDVKTPENISPGGQSSSADYVPPVQGDYTTLKLRDRNENGYTNISQADGNRSTPQRHNTYLKPQAGVDNNYLELSGIALTVTGSQKSSTYLKPIAKQTDTYINNELLMSQQSREIEGERDKNEWHTYETMK